MLTQEEIEGWNDSAKSARIDGIGDDVQRLRLAVERLLEWNEILKSDNAELHKLIDNLIEEKGRDAEYIAFLTKSKREAEN